MVRVKFTKFLLLVLLMCGSSFVFSQNATADSTAVAPATEQPASNSDDKKSKPRKEKAAKEKPVKEEKVAKEKTAKEKPKKETTAKSDTSSKVKDPQNQTQYLKPDFESKQYNFYRRREISTPLQPRDDLDSAVYQKKGKKELQQQSYVKKNYVFPARPRDQWEISLNLGCAMISGDVKPLINPIQNFGVGLNVRKALGYMFSLRGGYNFYFMTGRNWEPDANLTFNPALRGLKGYDPRVNYWDNPALDAANTITGKKMNKLFFYNYRTFTHDVHIDGMITLGNVSFHRERSLLSFYIFGGINGFFYNTKMDALDDDGNVHDFSEVMAVYTGTSNTNTPHVNDRLSRRKDALKELKGVLDGKYETEAEREHNVPGIKGFAFVPAGSVGGGIAFHVSKWVTLGLEERIIISGSDLLDGYRWQQDEHNGVTRDNDNISYTSININFNIGKNRVEPLTWMNPMYHTYRKLGEVDPQGVADNLFKDDDDDGVPNSLDKEPNTEKDCPVDVKGRALDSDKDGIIDCHDVEPFSPPGFPIDSAGVAIIPPNPCCDTSGIGTGPGGPGGPKGKKGNGNYDCSKIELPSVVFDEDKYYIDPQYYGNLHQIAERMQMCPDMKLVVTGYDESKNDQKYNEQLAWNRAQATVDYMVEKYGISRDRFVLKYQGGKKAAGGTAYEKKMKNKVEFRYANEGETGESNPPAPHPGLKAGSNK